MAKRLYNVSTHVWNAGRKKARVTSAIKLLNRISVDATGREENQVLIGCLAIAIEELKEYKDRLNAN